MILHTTSGDIEIELWGKEAPRATRNFIQLCLEGYYDNTIFHRIIPDFLVQGGDPTGTGQGNTSICLVKQQLIFFFFFRWRIYI